MEILRNIQPEDMEAFANLPDEQVNEILKDTPEYLFSDRSVKMSLRKCSDKEIEDYLIQNFFITREEAMEEIGKLYED